MIIFNPFKLKRLKFEERIFEKDGIEYKAISNYDYFESEILVPLNFIRKDSFEIRGKLLYIIELQNTNPEYIESFFMDTISNRDDALIKLRTVSKYADKVKIFIDKTMKIQNVVYSYHEYTIRNDKKIKRDKHDTSILLIDDDYMFGMFGLLERSYY